MSACASPSLVLAAAGPDTDVEGLILVAPALRSRDTLGPLLSRGLAFFAYAVPWFPSGPTSIDFQPTDNPDTIDQMRKDPMILRNVRVDLAYGLVEAMDVAKAAAPTVAKPYLMQHGLGDRLVPLTSVKSVDDSHMAFYREGLHMLLRDKNGAAVARDVVAWINDKHAALPSGADVERLRPNLAKLWGSKRLTNPVSARRQSATP